MKLYPALLAPMLLAGCTRDDAAIPSLLPRLAEKQGFAEPALSAPAAAVVDPVLDARLKAAGAKLDGIARGFDADAARADRAAGVAGARTVGSEAWITAQTALAALDDWRAQAAEVTTEVDDLVRARVETVGSAYPPLDVLRDRTATEATREATRIAALSAKLPQP